MPREAFTFQVLGAGKAAECLGLTPQRLRQLVRDGFIEVEGRDKYRVDKVVQGYAKFMRDDARRASKSVGASEVSKARAKLLDVQTEERIGELKREAIAEAMSAVDRVIGPLKAEIFSVAARVTADLSLRQKIEDEIEGVFGRSSGRSRDIRKGDRESRTAAEADEEDDT